MRKRINSANSSKTDKSSTESRPREITKDATEEETIRSSLIIDGSDAEQTRNSRGFLDTLQLLVNRMRGYRKKHVCIITMVAMLVIVSLSSTVGRVLAKSGIVYKAENGRKQILTPEEILSSKHKDIKVSRAKSFAVVINTFKRPDMLKSALNHWVNTCGVEYDISQVFVVWAELDVEPPKPGDILSEFAAKNKKALRTKKIGGTESSSQPSVEFIRVPKDSLNSRFLPIENLKTDAVFMVDDDVRVECTAMKAGFEAWRYNPNSLVGFYPRLASPKLGLLESTSNMIYHTWPIVFARQKFNIILTKASYFDRKYLEMYHDDKENPKEVLEYVDQHKNCEDIAMAFLVARKAERKEGSDAYCRDCPVYTSGKITDEGLLNGISTSGGSLQPQGHMTKRSECLDAMIKIYEKRGWKYPLFDVKLGEQSWKHYYWWQNSPNNFFEWFSVGNTLM